MDWRKAPGEKYNVNLPRQRELVNGLRKILWNSEDEVEQECIEDQLYGEAEPLLRKMEEMAREKCRWCIWWEDDEERCTDVLECDAFKHKRTGAEI